MLLKLIEEQLQGTSEEIRNISENLRWNRIKKEIDQVHNHFTVRLKVHFSALKEEQIRLCCLIRVGMDSYGITRCLNISKEYLRTKRSRLAKVFKIRNRKGELDRFIREF
jgi:DNA-binding CsgD family transcriptional regulator